MLDCQAPYTERTLCSSKIFCSYFSSLQREASRPNASSIVLGSAYHVLSVTYASGMLVVSLTEGASWPVRNRRST